MGLERNKRLFEEIFSVGGEVMGNQIPGKYGKYVETDLPKFVAVPGHHELAPFWIGPDMFPGVKLRVAGLDASKIVGAPHANPHQHDTPEIYLAPSEGKGEIVVEIQMEDEKFVIHSPFAVFIPPGVKHCFKVVKCETTHYVLGILLPEWKG
jgi:mannose-6-phosphate isomerase-like protein (cupin superfamily)